MQGAMNTKPLCLERPASPFARAYFIMLIVIIGAFSLAGSAAAYAAGLPAASDSPEAETLFVDDLWLAGAALHITVTDKLSEESRALEMDLRDYMQPGDEYVTVQATGSGGRVSNAVRFKNPYYAPADEAAAESGDLIAANQEEIPAETPKQSESAVPEGASSFAPAGQGEITGNATSGDGKEFFTVGTADGNVFYLIVDRQRTADNVYFLDAVTERDLLSLAEPGDGKSVNQAEPPPAAAAPAPEPTPPEPQKNGGIAKAAALIIIAALAVSAGYYIKILRPKKLGISEAEDYEDETEGSGDFDASDIDEERGDEE